VPCCVLVSRIDRVQMSRMRRPHRHTPSPSQHWVLRPRWYGGQLVNVWMTRSLCAHCQRCAFSTPAQQGEATLCRLHSSASPSFTSRWLCSSMQQAGGKARQSNATGGKSAALHKISWCSGVNRVKSRWCLCAANPFEHSSYLLAAAGLAASAPKPPAVGPPRRQPRRH
jgi:hypothetical protein